MRSDGSLRLPRKEAGKAAAGGGGGTGRDPTNGPKDPSQRFKCHGWYGTDTVFKLLVCSPFHCVVAKRFFFSA